MASKMQKSVSPLSTPVPCSRVDSPWHVLAAGSGIGSSEKVALIRGLECSPSWNDHTPREVSASRGSPHSRDPSLTLCCPAPVPRRLSAPPPRRTTDARTSPFPPSCSNPAFARNRHAQPADHTRALDNARGELGPSCLCASRPPRRSLLPPVAAAAAGSSSAPHGRRTRRRHLPRLDVFLLS